MRKNILYIAYHFPPIAESSGVLRTLSYIRALQEDGYKITVLTVTENALKQVSPQNLKMIPDDVDVIRCKAWDWGAMRFTGGRYPSFLACPDRYSCWLFSGFLKGKQLIAALKPAAIISTSPMPTAHLLGYMLTAKNNIPWVTDFRDPLAQIDYPANKRLRKVHWWLEGKAAENSSLRIFATSAARQSHIEYFPTANQEQALVLENGYDERFFTPRNLRHESLIDDKQLEGPLRLFHSGSISLDDRDPSAFIQALATCRGKLEWPIEGVEIVFRCAEKLPWLEELISFYKVQDIVTIKSVVEFNKSIRESELAHGLLLFQGSSCDQQIPAKAYEYIRAQRPVISMCGEQGATTKLMSELGLGPVVGLNDTQKIVDALVWFFDAVKDWRTPLSGNDIDHFSRQHQAEEFALNVSKVITSRQMI